MKAVAAFLLTLFGLIVAFASPAQADDYYYWPVFGTFESNSDWSAKAVKAPQAHALGANGAGVKVAILDDGISSSANGLSNKVIAYKDFLPGNFVRAEHGTMVASTIASEHESAVGIRGIAPGVSLIVARVCQNSSCDTIAIRRGLAWAIEQGAQIVSMSFTGSSDPAMLATFKAAEKKGVLVVTAMGNSGCGPYTNWGLNPYCLQGKTRESTQGGYPIAGLLAVGASDQRGARVSTLGWSSSYGPNMDLIAPGTDTTAYDSVAASNGFGGTSSAAPIVASVAALVLQMNPSLRPDQVQAILQATSSKAIEEKAKVWDSCSYDSESKNWSCNQVVDSEFPQQYFTGSGVVNAENAVAMAKASAQGRLLEPVLLSQNNLVLTINWQGGPADLYINSKLVAKGVATGYQYQGYASQSVAVQIKRFQEQSLPALALMVDYVVPQKPIVTRPFIDSEYQLRFEVAHLEDQIDTVWRKKNPWDSYAEYSGVFEFHDGEIVGCHGNNHLSDLANFYCPFQPARTQASGTFRLVSKSAHLSEPSETVTTNLPKYWSPISISSTYSENGLPRFDWTEIANAKSYRYHYEPVDLQYCTQDRSFTVPRPMTQPSVFWVEAFDGTDCTGLKIGASEHIGWISQLAKPEKLAGITVKSTSYQHVEFDVPNLNPAAQLRIYRSDGLMVRINPGQRVIVGMQNNEDVNGKIFGYRFVQIMVDSFSQSWSDPSDVVFTSLPRLISPTAECSEGGTRFVVNCTVNTVSGTQRTRIEYLDSDMVVLGSKELESPSQRLVLNQKAPRNTAFVKVAATMGDEKTRNSWYRRGESQLVEISLRKRIDSLARAY